MQVEIEDQIAAGEMDVIVTTYDMAKRDNSWLRTLAT